jgi:hypothetical protein
MAEASLSITYSDLLAEVGRYLGYGRDTGQWSTDERADVDSVIKSGLRQFYVPPPISANEPPYSWSFLKPIDTITTQTDTSVYDLPDDFGGVEGNFTFEDGSGKHFIPLSGEGIVRQMQSLNDKSGVPSIAAVRPKSCDGTTGQRFELVLWKTPDDTYVLSYRKIVLLNALTDLNPYPLGGMTHGETILASCLAIAELRLNDGQRGLNWQAFMSRLAASVFSDRKMNAPGFLGYNGDRSDDNDRQRERTTIVTYNGVEG